MCSSKLLASPLDPAGGWARLGQPAVPALLQQESSISLLGSRDAMGLARSSGVIRQKHKPPPGIVLANLDNTSSSDV